LPSFPFDGVSSFVAGAARDGQRAHYRGVPTATAAPGPSYIVAKASLRGVIGCDGGGDDGGDDGDTTTHAFIVKRQKIRQALHLQSSNTKRRETYWRDS